MILNKTRQTTLATHRVMADKVFKRMAGLIGRAELAKGEAMVITHCRSIHMFFMRFPIDVVFCDKTHTVVGYCKNIKPYQVSPIFFKASYAIELPTGTITSTHTRIGDVIDLCVKDLKSS